MGLAACLEQVADEVDANDAGAAAHAAQVVVRVLGRHSGEACLRGHDACTGARQRP